MKTSYFDALGRSFFLPSRAAGLAPKGSWEGENLWAHAKSQTTALLIPRRDKGDSVSRLLLLLERLGPIGSRLISYRPVGEPFAATTNTSLSIRYLLKAWNQQALSFFTKSGNLAFLGVIFSSSSYFFFFLITVSIKYTVCALTIHKINKHW